MAALAPLTFVVVGVLCFIAAIGHLHGGWVIVGGGDHRSLRLQTEPSRKGIPPKPIPLARIVTAKPPTSPDFLPVLS
jgi:hypothetical protein